MKSLAATLGVASMVLFCGSGIYDAQAAQMRICSGFGCVIKDRFTFSAEDQAKLVRLMEAGKGSPEAERKILAEVIGVMEAMARRKLRYRPDVKKSYQVNKGKRGQMDCVDESLNTIGYLNYLKSLGLLRHHQPDQSYATRGFILDGRYPHKSASMRDASGRRWTVDSWYRGDGQPAQVMPHKQWQKVRDSFGS